jgi:hypothetical protein
MRFRIYNLCCELTYDTTKFEERTARYPFPDHNPSAFEMISRICEDMHEWYHRHAKNVIAVHCKAGKGRTGYVISCFLLYERMVTDAESALNMFSALRTYDDQGVTVPSQRRYVHYFARLLDQNGWFGGPQFSDSLDEKVGVGNQDYIGLKSEDSAQSLSTAGPSVIEHPPDASPSCENANALAADGVSVPDQSSNYKASACHLALGGDIGPETKEYNSSKEASRAQPPPPPSIFWKSSPLNDGPCMRNVPIPPTRSLLLHSMVLRGIPDIALGGPLWFELKSPIMDAKENDFDIKVNPKLTTPFYSSQHLLLSPEVRVCCNVRREMS